MIRMTLAEKRGKFLTYDFADDHGLILPGDPPPRVLVEQYAGVAGASFAANPAGFRQLECSYLIVRDNMADLQTAIDQIVLLHGRLGGTVTPDNVTGVSFTNCVFLGYFANGNINIDHGGSNRYWSKGRLRWLQDLTPTA